MQHLQSQSLFRSFSANDWNQLEHLFLTQLFKIFNFLSLSNVSSNAENKTPLTGCIILSEIPIEPGVMNNFAFALGEAQRESLFCDGGCIFTFPALKSLLYFLEGDNPMHRILLLLVGIFLNFPGLLIGELINRPVVNIYLQPQEDTEIDSQAIYGSVVEIVDHMNDWSKIRTIDGVEGWVLSSQLTTNPSYESNGHLRPIKSLFAHIYRVTDTTPYPPLLTIPYGSKVKLDETVDTGERWVSMELLSGEKVWIQRGDVDFSPQFKTLEEALAFSKKFLGLPYTWGGTSSYGFDCSGFMQMLFREMGLQLPRNSRDQAGCNLFTPVAQEDLQPGDLVFFGKTRITHVGLYLGNDEFIHSGVTELPMVMISNIKSGKYNFQAARRIDPLMVETYRMNFH